jgi:hypothetical protein
MAHGGTLETIRLEDMRLEILKYKIFPRAS